MKDVFTTKKILLFISGMTLILMCICFVLIYFRILPVLFFVFLIISSLISIVLAIISILSFDKKLKFIAIIETLLASAFAVTFFNFAIPISYNYNRDKSEYNIMEKKLKNSTHFCEPTGMFNGSSLSIYCFDNDAKQYQIDTSLADDLKNKILNINYVSTSYSMPKTTNKEKYLLIKSNYLVNDMAFDIYNYIKEDGELFIKIIGEYYYSYYIFEYYYSFDVSEFDIIYQMAQDIIKP